MIAAEVRRPDRPDHKGASLAFGLVLGGVASAVVFGVMPHAGEIAVNVADSKGSAIPQLAVYVDGKKHCDSAPCVVPDVAAGAHTVKVEAHGFEPPAEKAIAVESRKDATIDFSLVPAPAGGTGIRIAGTQPGTELLVDGKEVGPLPVDLHDMAPGSHRIRVAGGDRYAAVETTVTLAREERQDLGTVALKVLKGRVTPVLETQGARVFIASDGDRWELPALPVSVDLDTSKSWSLVASKPGFEDYVQPIQFDDGQAEKTFRIAMEPKATRAALGNPPSTRYLSPHRPVAPIDRANDGANDGAKVDGAGTAQAFLKINSIPASSIVLDGKPIGYTPLARYRVTPGEHSLVFLNADQGFERQIRVSVAAGETKAAIARN